MDIKNGFIGSVGDTPLIRLPRLSEETGCEILETLGAEVRAVPAVPYRDLGNYQKVAGRLAQEIEGAVWANQFDNIANREIHERTTGTEIWAQTGGGVDAFVAATGTGGTLAGVGRALKARKPGRETTRRPVLALRRWMGLPVP